MITLIREMISFVIRTRLSVDVEKQSDSYITQYHILLFYGWLGQQRGNYKCETLQLVSCVK